MKSSKLISVGKILNFHGVRGEVKVGFTAGKEGRDGGSRLIENLKKVFVFLNDEKTELNVEYVRFHKNVALVKFKEINSINDVMHYKGLLIHIYEDEVKKGLDEDEYLISDLVGLDAFDTSGHKVGIVDIVGENKASDLISIRKPDGRTFMVPFVKELVPVVDLMNNRIVINLIEGLDE